jgi:hypothetical protein
LAALIAGLFPINLSFKEKKFVAVDLQYYDFHLQKFTFLSFKNYPYYLKLIFHLELSESLNCPY